MLKAIREKIIIALDGVTMEELQKIVERYEERFRFMEGEGYRNHNGIRYIKAHQSQYQRRDKNGQFVK